MGRIEDAIAKLQAARSSTPRRVSPPPPLAKVTEAVRTEAHEQAYAGKQVEVDVGALRAQGLLAPDNQARRLEDEYRIIKRPLLKNASINRDPVLPRGNLLMVASATPGEGKTFTCINLSLSIAREEDWTVVLVDGDCAKPHLTRLFGAEREPGLMDLLRDPRLRFDDVVMPTSVPGLSLVPAGRRDEQAVELLASERMEALCSSVSEEGPHRMVVFDSSPLLYTTESLVLASQVGQISVVVQAGKTSQQAVLAALGKLDPSKAISMILNQAAAGSVGGGYGGYGEYGDYGHADR